MNTPTEAEIQKSMQETGMDYLQARRSMIQRRKIVADLQRNPPKYPWGKSQHYSGPELQDEFCPFNTINS